MILRKFCLGVAAILMTMTGAVAAEKDAAPLRVVASFSILADMVHNVGGDAVEVSALVGPNSDAHVFEPTPSDAKRVAQADLVIVNGLHFEGWIDRLIKASGYRGPVAVASEGITARLLNGEPDPHAWQSLANARLYVENIRAALARALPARASEIDRRAAAYVRKIDMLEKKVKSRFAAIPTAERRVVTSHDAFGYFGAAYGVEFLAPQGWTTENEPSAADVARVIDQIKTQRVRAVFIENITDPRLVERIAREAGGLRGGTLYSDALSAPGTEADTYLKLFNHNATVLTTALSQATRKPTHPDTTR